MKDFDLRKYLAEGKLLKEEQGYTLYTTNVEYDNGKTGYMYQLTDTETEEENEIGFDQLYFDDKDNRLEMGVDFKDFDQGSYQEGEYTADEAMKLYKDLAEGKLLKEDVNGIKFINKFNPSQEIIDSYNENPHLKKPLSSFSRYKKDKIIASLITHLSTGQASYDLNLSNEDKMKPRNEDMVEIWADNYWKDSDFFTYGMYVDKDYFEFFNANKDLYPGRDTREKVPSWSDEIK